VNADGYITSIDALWVLWVDAGLFPATPIPEAADLNGDGIVDSVDALFILWIDGGLMLPL
jgi:hypothetical protein